jgi:hypothetical protein
VLVRYQGGRGPVPHLPVGLAREYPGQGGVRRVPPRRAGRLVDRRTGQGMPEAYPESVELEQARRHGRPECVDRDLRPLQDRGRAEHFRGHVAIVGRRHQ